MALKYKLYSLFYYIKYLIIELCHSQCYVIHGYFPLNNKGEIGKFNLGDDLNLSLLPLITSGKIIPYQYSILSHILNKNIYSCIGSIIASADKNTVIWGSGAIENSLKENFCFKKILSVRGPLTRKLLVENGYDCPKAYGDPALLISKYYKPDVCVKYKLGIIPHYVDLDNPILCSIKESRDVKIINFHEYSNWQNVIDQILSCGFIISSSLHGLILCDSYNIPNIWCKFSSKIYGQDFKFRDYLLSVNRENNMIPFNYDKDYNISSLLSLQKQYTPPTIDFNSIVMSCPFKIKL